MTFRDAMKDLEAAGTAQNRKVYARHGISGAMFGVGFADLGKLKKRIGTDQALAERLWASGNHDARVLATMVADAEAMGSAQLDAWANDLDNYVLADALSGLVARSPHAAAKVKKWTKSSGEWTGQVGWNVIGHRIRAGAASPDEGRQLLEAIERGIHRAPNRVRHSMNGVLIGIGLMGGPLFEEAMAASRRIGTVEVDHGETGCKTPDAVAYLMKNEARVLAAGAKEGGAKAKSAGAKGGAKAKTAGAKGGAKAKTAGAKANQRKR